jgi:hypothetical protein
LYCYHNKPKDALRLGHKTSITNDLTLILVYIYGEKKQSEGDEEKRRTLEKLRKKKNREENFRKRETHPNICRNVE